MLDFTLLNGNGLEDIGSKKNMEENGGVYPINGDRDNV